MRKIFALLFMLFSINTFAQTKDIIPKLNLKAGIVDSFLVSDLIYADNYNIEPLANEAISVKYNATNNYLYLKPGKNSKGFYPVELRLNNNPVSFPVFVKQPVYTTFTFKPSGKFNEISVFGEFNGWDRHKDKLSDPDGDGIYSVKLEIDPGKYQYKFYVDGKEYTDPNNSDSISNGMGSFNSIIEVPDNEDNLSFLHNYKFDSNEHTAVFRYYYENHKRSNKLNLSEIIAFLDNQKVSHEDITVNDEVVSVELPKTKLTGRHYLRIAVNSNGVSTNLQTTVIFDGKPVDNNAPFEWHDGIIYSLMIDRFANGDKANDNPIVHDSLFDKANYYGGDFKGLIDKIKEGYFDSLGINVLWISPVNENPNEPYREYPAPHRWFSGYHGYWPISPNKVEEHFGDMSLLKELVSEAHNHKIKVLIDFVSNHVHKDHPYFRQHRDWFGKLELPDGRLNLRLWDEQRLTTWFEPYLPSFDYVNSTEALETMTDNAIWWLKTTGADGFRHDAVKHVPNIFWRTLTRKLKSEFPGRNVYQIGETFGNYDLVSSYVNNGQLSSQFNFNLYNVAQAAFIDTNTSFVDLAKELKKTEYIYGQIHLMGNIMDSHDKNRYIAYADGDLDLSQWNATEEGWNNPPKVDDPLSYKKAELYYSYMFAIPGLPVIYYGSEFGMSGASDPDNRRPMRFGDQLSDNEKEMLKNVKHIATLRNKHSALRYGDTYIMESGKDKLVFMRSDMNERIIIVINNSDKPQKITFRLPEFIESEVLKDLVSNRKLYTERGLGSIVLDKYSYAYLKIME